jgi:hypothetical protein
MRALALASLAILVAGQCGPNRDKPFPPNVDKCPTGPATGTGGAAATAGGQSLWPLYVAALDEVKRGPTNPVGFMSGTLLWRSSQSFSFVLQVDSVECVGGTSGKCGTDTPTPFVKRELAYDIDTGRMRGTILTNQCPDSKTIHAANLKCIKQKFPGINTLPDTPCSRLSAHFDPCLPRGRHELRPSDKESTTGSSNHRARGYGIGDW